MIYTDKIHLITDHLSLKELHEFAKKIGLRKKWFKNNKNFKIKEIHKGIKIGNKLFISKLMFEKIKYL